MPLAAAEFPVAEAEAEVEVELPVVVDAEVAPPDEVLAAVGVAVATVLDCADVPLMTLK